MNIKTITGPNFEVQVTDPEALSRALITKRSNLDTARRLSREAKNPHAPGILARELTTLAWHTTLARQWPEAETLFKEAILQWTTLKRQRALWLARLKQANLWRRQQLWTRAINAQSDLLLLSEEEPLTIYRDFALYERGLTFFLSDQPDEARQDLEAALLIRKEKGAARMIHEVEQVLKAL